MFDEPRRRAQAAAALETMAAAAGADPRKLGALARMAARAGKPGDAYRYARDARALAPGDAEIASATDEPIAAAVPSWHFRIVADKRRNAAYAAAIERAVRPGMRVLDIGSGTGLLAMMAARAGAASVVSCEMDPAVADIAGRIVAANGFADRIRIVAKNSRDLDVAADLGGPVDVLVSEIVSNDLLGEAALPTIEDVVRRGLLKPGGVMIPARGSLHVALADYPEWDRQQLARVAGFDLSAFNTLQHRPQMVNTLETELRLRSVGAELFGFDFTRGRDWPPARTALPLVADGGRVNGILQWMRLDLDADTVYEVSPASGMASSWAALLFPLDRAMQPPAGSAVTVQGAHDQQSVRCWVDG